MSDNVSIDVRSQVANYRQRGWYCVPLRPRSKMPVRNDWPNVRIEAADVKEHFAAKDNVGIILGEPSAWLVDVEGTLFAPLDAEVELDEDTPEGAVRAGLPVVDDQRLIETPPVEGDRLRAIDLDAMRQLLALDSELLGPRASDLWLRVDDKVGYVLSSRDRAWRALFGHYTLTLQPPDVIPQQVQCLQWVLASGPRKLEQVRLAVSEGGCGTWTVVDDAKPKDD